MRGLARLHTQPGHACRAGAKAPRGAGGRHARATLRLPYAQTTLPHPTLPYPTLPYPTLPYRACGAAGLLGIGGGSIISPLLIELNVNPAVGGATASLMVVFSGSLSLLSYALSGSLNVTYGAVYGVTAFVAAAVGATVIGHIVRRTGKASHGPAKLCLLAAAAVGCRFGLRVMCFVTWLY